MRFAKMAETLGEMRLAALLHRIRAVERELVAADEPVPEALQDDRLVFARIGPEQRDHLAECDQLVETGQCRAYDAAHDVLEKLRIHHPIDDEARQRLARVEHDE